MTLEKTKLNDVYDPLMEPIGVEPIYEGELYGLSHEKAKSLASQPFYVDCFDLSEEVADYLLSLDDKEFDKTIKFIQKGIRKARKRLERKLKNE